MLYKCKECGCEFWKDDDTPVYKCVECGCNRLRVSSDEDSDDSLEGLY